MKVRDMDPAYVRDYSRGWQASMHASDVSGVSPLERADDRNEPRAWYDGYLDYAADREKWHMARCADHDKCP